MNSNEVSSPSLEHDIRNSPLICKKIIDSVEYSTDLYSALCNNVFQKMELMPMLVDNTWSCSWRYAGSIIASIRDEGNYLDWYCSGKEGNITEEILNDITHLKWKVIEGEYDE